jgi:hypothetical protein
MSLNGSFGMFYSNHSNHAHTCSTMSLNGSVGMFNLPTEQTGSPVYLSMEVLRCLIYNKHIHACLYVLHIYEFTQVEGARLRRIRILSLMLQTDVHKEKALCAAYTP